MAGVASGGSGDSRPFNEGSTAGEALVEWRSSEQLENGTPSTSPPYWDTDEDDDDSGPRPSELYGKYTWKIDKFSQINKRELRSNAFEVGGYKWYILIYPQGCDVCNHLSLFLCVANHDKLLPGWSHFAQFTIAVVNKDPKKSKYSDTLHRFWKKEHDWGWKKFMELSKVLDGFIDNDTLIIKAQVQVIREKSVRPFRCLDCQYRRELVRVYLTNVEQICRKFVEEKRTKLRKLIEDKARWSSFCGFWLAIDQKSRRNMTRERTNTILKSVVKNFFIEKEVTSTLVMDSLYSGLKALEGQVNSKKDGHKTGGIDESPDPVVFVDQDMFLLVDDVLLLLQRAALEPMPPKDDKGPQNRMKDGSSGDDFSKESIERDERRLTELGRRTIEIFVLNTIFGKIEGAYQEAVALKRQEELIREEEAWLEIENKSKRGAAEREKKSKKKQGKQKRNNRKGKDKTRDDIVIVKALGKLQMESPEKRNDSVGPDLEKPETFEDDSDVSDTVDLVNEAPHLDSEERESILVNSDTDMSSVLHLTEASGSGASNISVPQNGKKEINGSYTIDDSSSTCSTDSVPSVAINGSDKANQEWNRSPTREMNHRGMASSDMSGWVRVNIRSSDARRDVGQQNGPSGSRKAESEPEASKESFHNKINKVEQPVLKGPTILNRTEPNIKPLADTQIPQREKKTTKAPSVPISSSVNTSPAKPNPELKIIAPAAKISIKKPVSDSPQLAPRATNSAEVAFSSRSESSTHSSPLKPIEKPSEVRLMSRPLSAPIVPDPRPSTPVVSMVQTQPLLSRSVSAVGRLGTDSLPHHYQSYRNAMLGVNTQSPNMALNLSQPHPTPTQSIYTPTFGMVSRPTTQNDVHALDIFNQVRSSPLDPFSMASPACTSGRRSNWGLIDEFPHLDIINDILDDENENFVGSTGMSTSYQNFDDVAPHLNRQFSYPGDFNMTNDTLAGSSSSSGRFQRTFSYQENGFQPPSYSPYESTRDFYLQQNMRNFQNGQIDGLSSSQWQVPASDLSYMNTRTSDGGGYTYCVPEYSNFAGNSNGYSVFRPNGQ